ncbi:FecR family protein [Fodinibius sp. Rm-B-1B1-1]|uniref:FecR family protein n=1 Tax=Fodinibius alkaliphilus TaxID=3140241 RepID=UPI0031599824
MNKAIAYIVPLLVIGIIGIGATIYSVDDRPLAFVQKFKPSVGLENNGTITDIQERGRPLFDGDTLRTDQNGFALVQFMDKSMAKIKPDSRLIVRGDIEDKQNTSTRIGLELGEILLNVSERGAQNFEVATNSSVASVKGTSFGATHDDYFWVEEGEVEVTSNKSGESVTLGEKSYGQVQEDGSIESGELTDEELEERNSEYAEMDEKVEPTIYKVRFTNEDGEERVIDVKVFENEN